MLLLVERGCNVSFQWNIAASTLEILHKLLAEHEVKAEDFVDEPCVDFVQPNSSVPSIMSKPPGHTLLVHLSSDSAMLKTVSHSFSLYSTPFFSIGIYENTMK